MSAFDTFKTELLEITGGQNDRLTKKIDNHEIVLASMPYGYYLNGRLALEWDGSEQELHRHLQISMALMNHNELSLAADPDTKALFVSQYLPKPKSIDELMAAIEGLVTILEIWPSMYK